MHKFLSRTTAVLLIPTLLQQPGFAMSNFVFPAKHFSAACNAQALALIGSANYVGGPAFSLSGRGLEARWVKVRGQSVALPLHDLYKEALHRTASVALTVSVENYITHQDLDHDHHHQESAAIAEILSSRTLMDVLVLIYFIPGLRDAYTDLLQVTLFPEAARCDRNGEL